MRVFLSTLITKKNIIWLYALFIHILLGAFFVKSELYIVIRDYLGGHAPELSDAYYHHVGFQARMSANISADGFLFIGDSHVQGLAVPEITRGAYNFGIGGDTTEGVIRRLQHHSINPARGAFLLIGFNDLNRRTDNEIAENIERIIETAGNLDKLLLCSLLPTSPLFENSEEYNKRIGNINDALKQISQKYTHVHYVDAFSALSDGEQLLDKFSSKDGIHLNPNGNKALINLLRSHIH
ncbi:SGNH/GDSL hydrolase family protein [Aestuariibacter salexigens]|uniref:SGNH/GDSL hydrolase family protein n=1 Tax=Aestuariibacter salexigens TaxID=226010 RepID=UPI000406A31C|nr:GDSL-type esterase/lipase family protein [Aestuariibacter salexigens]